MNKKFSMNNLKLNPKLFDKDVEQAPIRQGYGDRLSGMNNVDNRKPR